MKTEKTHKEIRELDATISLYFINNGYWDKEKKQFSKKELTKLSHNMKNIKKQAEKILEQYTSDRDDLQIDHCAIDEKTKAMLKHPDGTRQFTQDGEKKLKAALKNLDETKVTIHARITEGEWDLTDEEKEVFSGILIPEIPKQEEEPS